MYMAFNTVNYEGIVIYGVYAYMTYRRRIYNMCKNYVCHNDVYNGFMSFWNMCTFDKYAYMLGDYL